MTGVDISTRPVRRLGREGKAKKRTSLRTAAEANRVAFRLSITMLNDSEYTPIYLCAFIDIAKRTILLIQFTNSTDLVGLLSHEYMGKKGANSRFAQLFDRWSSIRHIYLWLLALLSYHVASSVLSASLYVLALTSTKKEGGTCKQ